MQSSRLPLLDALNAERTALQNFVALLEREQGMLLENLTDQLFELSGQKSADALELNRLTEACSSLLLKNLPALSPESIRSWLAAEYPQGLTVWEEIMALAERAQRLNQITGNLIQMKLQRNQQLQAALNKAANKANLYGRNGRTNFSPGSGRSLGSG